MYKLRTRLRNAAAIIAVLSLAACAGKGCSCVQPIKGGFPVAKRRENAIQIRATQSLFQYVSANGAKLIPGLIGGNTFNVPPTCTGNKVCCSSANMVCTLAFDFQSLQLTPTSPNSLHLDTNVNVKTTTPLPIDASIIGTCNIAIDSSAGPMNATSDLSFVVDKNTNTTALAAANTAVSVPDNDITISGGIGCSIANFALFKGIVVGILQD